MFDVNVVKSGYALEFLPVPTRALWRCGATFSVACLPPMDTAISNRLTCNEILHNT